MRLIAVAHRRANFLILAEDRPIVPEPLYSYCTLTYMPPLAGCSASAVQALGRERQVETITDRFGFTVDV